MDDLVQWLGEQYDEEQQAAEEALRKTTTTRRRIGGEWVEATVQPPEWRRSAWPPERVLRDIDVKRQLLVEFREAGSMPDTPENRARHDWPGDFGYLQGLARAVRIAAVAYADRPGYLEEWRP
ncbi:DUF6221 family protein [Streptomyces sp. NPDC050439]|uniref:DUF6221 family protein n=1 Tax=unclassified Streptomyces TaxID=2593676 RepID=UPI003440476B